MISSSPSNSLLLNFRFSAGFSSHSTLLRAALVAEISDPLVQVEYRSEFASNETYTRSIMLLMFLFKQFLINFSVFSASCLLFVWNCNTQGTSSSPWGITPHWHVILPPSLIKMEDFVGNGQQYCHPSLQLPQKYYRSLFHSAIFHQLVHPKHLYINGNHKQWSLHWKCSPLLHVQYKHLQQMQTHGIS